MTKAQKLTKYNLLRYEIDALYFKRDNGKLNPEEENKLAQLEREKSAIFKA